MLHFRIKKHCDDLLLCLKISVTEILSECISTDLKSLDLAGQRLAFRGFVRTGSNKMVSPRDQVLKAWVALTNKSY